MSNRIVTAGPQVIVLGGFQVCSAVSDIELEQEYNLARGKELLVKDTEGTLIYEGIRGFLPLTSETHLLRLKDGSWWLFFLSSGKKRKLQKVNLKHGDIHLMFDERGKLRYNQECYSYQYLEVA